MPRVRPAGRDDVEAATAVHDGGRRAYYAVGGADPGPPDQRRRETWRLLLGSPEHRVWVAEQDEGITGVLAAGRPVHDQLGDEPVLELIALYVDPATWGRGTGSALHDVFVQELATGPWTAGVLDVWNGNDRARGFYAARGWVLDGRSRPAEVGGSYLGLRLALPR